MIVKKRKVMKKTPLMFGGPTPVNRPPAMAGGYLYDGRMGGGYLDDGPLGADEIEMPADFVGPGANPNVTGEPPPPGSVPAPTGIPSTIMGVSTGLFAAGAAVAAYFLFFHKK